MIHRFFSQLTIFLQYRLYQHLPYGHYYRVLYCLAPWALWRAASDTPLQSGLEKMGPIFIKFGQFLSGRSDLFSPSVINQLNELCDNVRLASEKPFLEALSRLSIDHKIQISSNPIAAASIAQVYAGSLPDGAPIAIKIQRPDLEKIVTSDLRILRVVFFLASLIAPRRLQLNMVFQRFSNTLMQEMNFRREAAQADALREALTHSRYSQVCGIPKIYWAYTTHSLIVMDKVPGLKLQSIIGLQLDQAIQKKMAKDFYNIFLHSVFQHGLFHADLHAGNIFFDLSCQKFWFVDFGIVARLDEKMHKLLCRQVLALLRKDYVGMAQAFVDGGWTPEGFTLLDKQNFEWSLHMLIAPLMEKSLREISLASVLTEMITVANEYEIKVQPEMMLLKKTLFVVESIVRSLDPEMNLIQAGSDEVLHSIRNRYGVQKQIMHWLNPLL